MKSKRLAAFGLSVTLTACLTAAGKRVVVTEDRDLVKPCRLLGRVKSAAGDLAWGHLAGAAADEGNESGMRSDVTDLGGNVLLLTGRTRGEAYLCDEAALAAIRPQPLPTPIPKP